MPSTPASARDRLRAKIEQAQASGSFVKMTLSDYAGEEDGLRNLYVRPVELKDGPHLQCVYRYERRDVTKNIPPADLIETIDRALESGFERAYLFTTGGDFQWRGPGDGQLKAKRATFAILPPQEHDRSRPKTIGDAPWLKLLGLTDESGAPRPGMAAKVRQIERFAEILGHAVADSPLAEAKAVRIADLGAGKGYLTFAAHEYFRRRGLEVQTTGIERRADLVEKVNAVAERAAVTGLHFETGEIASFEPEGHLDILVALHACDTATDDALHLGIRAGAKLILVAPCCHREIRQGLVPPPTLAPVLQHGILLERYAQLLTEGLRAVLLEIAGYEARVFEFIDADDTAKNVMIAARLKPHPGDATTARRQLRELLSTHGLSAPKLARHLADINEVVGCKE